jgi:hypothetical protein
MQLQKNSRRLELSHRGAEGASRPGYTNRETALARDNQPSAFKQILSGYRSGCLLW